MPDAEDRRRLNPGWPAPQSKTGSRRRALEGRVAEADSGTETPARTVRAEDPVAGSARGTSPPFRSRVRAGSTGISRSRRVPGFRPGRRRNRSGAGPHARVPRFGTGTGGCCRTRRISWSPSFRLPPLRPERSRRPACLPGSAGSKRVCGTRVSGLVFRSEPGSVSSRIPTCEERAWHAVRAPCSPPARAARRSVPIDRSAGRPVFG